MYCITEDTSLCNFYIMTLNLPLLVNLILMTNLKSWVQRLSPKYSTQRVTESDVWNWKVAEKEYIVSKSGGSECIGGGQRGTPSPFPRYSISVNPIATKVGRLYPKLYLPHTDFHTLHWLCKRCTFSTPPLIFPFLQGRTQKIFRVYSTPPS